MIDTSVLVASIRKRRFNYSNEKELQDGIEQAFLADAVPFEREKTLDEALGTIDFLVDSRIGVEIKIQGSPSAVGRQLIRYCRSALVQELVLVTGRSALGRLPRAMLGKKLTVVTLWQTFL